MLPDILRGRVPNRVASQFAVLILVDADIVHTHRRRHQRAETGHVERGEVAAHAEVCNYCEWFFRDDTLADVAVGADGVTDDFPGFDVADVPDYVAVSARLVFEAVALVGFAVVPVVVEVGDC